jgi:hypothetical protein
LSKPNKSDVLLANDWPVSKVVDCLQKESKAEIVEFLRARHQERFFDPIRHLTESKNKEGYGFAIMALCSLLVETLQSYRYGLPSTHEPELKSLKVPKTEWKTGKAVFADFFNLSQHQKIFPSMDGTIFYSNIRNGLLHQAQTKGGWKIKTDQPVLCDPVKKILDRKKFSGSIKLAFDEYLQELGSHDWADDIWAKAVRKIRFLVEMSQ